jgi:pyruvate dehydrogenase E2 component (dihydrolipoamide acetyltransferase)
MSALEPVVIPDLGDIDKVEVIELPVQAGASVKRDDVLLVLESDKASMEVVAPQDGTLSEVLVKEGDSVTSGQKVAVLATLMAEAPVESSEVAAETEASAPAPAAAEATAGGVTQAVGDANDAVVTESVPDLGDIDSATVIELSVAPGDSVAEGDPLLVLESDKASMEVPASRAGVVQSLLVKEGDSVGSGADIAQLKVGASGAVTGSSSASEVLPDASVTAGHASSAAPTASTAVDSAPKQPEPKQPEPKQPEPKQPVAAQSASVNPGPDSRVPAGDYPIANVSAQVHAGPAVRRLANALHVDLSQVTGSGPRGRVLKEDVHAFVKKSMKAIAAAPVGPSGSGLAPPLPDIDFSQWGEVEESSLSRIQKISAQHLHRSWSALPHVTQFEEADVTDLENFRREQKDRMAKKGVKLTPLAFMMKACALTLAEHPKFKASLKSDGATLVLKQYCHIGFACETPNGLVVPVVKDADQKSISQLAEEIVALSVLAREKKLKPENMKGAVFSISSLGGIGGTAFTPIINWPEVAILGVSKNGVKPHWNGQSFVPRTFVPLSLSYDHRVIDGADAARFVTTLKGYLEDLRQWML